MTTNLDVITEAFQKANITNERKIVAGSIKKDLLAKKQGRSELIAAQNVGLAESWARQREAELINDIIYEGLDSMIISYQGTDKEGYT